MLSFWFERRKPSDTRFRNYFSNNLNRASSSSCLLDIVSFQRDVFSYNSRNSWTRGLCLDFGNALDSSCTRSFFSYLTLYFLIGSVVCGITDVTCFGKSSSSRRLFGSNWFPEWTVEGEVALEADWERLSLCATIWSTISDH